MYCFPPHASSAKSKIKMHKILILEQLRPFIAISFYFFSFLFLLFYDCQPYHCKAMGKNYHGGWENPQNELFMNQIVIFVATIVNSLASDYTISK